MYRDVSQQVEFGLKQKFFVPHIITAVGDALADLEARFCMSLGISDTNKPDSLRDPAVESERFRRDFKTHLLVGHRTHERIRVVTQRLEYNSASCGIST